MSEGQKTAATTRAEQIKLYLELYVATADRQFQYGKWVLASLLAVHAGSLLAISQAGSKTAELYTACGPLLIYGVGTALVSGGLAWFNYTVAMVVYGRRVKSLRERKRFRLTCFHRIMVAITLWGTPLVAITSLVLFFIAANRATVVLAPELPL